MVIALCAVLGAIITFAPHRIDMIVGRGLIAGMVACIVYDGARLFAVHVLGLMGDFIPVMGSWVTGEPDTAGSAAVGYVWRYIGDGGGLGVAFFVVAFALGIDRWSNTKAVLAAVAFAVFPTWTGLIATVALAPHGEEMMFPLNTATISITLDRSPDLRLLPRTRLPEGAARRGPSRLAVDTDPGNKDRPQVHPRRMAT